MTKLISKQVLGVLALLGSSAGMAATVTIVASNSAPNIGDTFTVTIHGDNFVPTVGPTLGLAFDNTKVSYVSATLPASGPWAGSGGAFLVLHPSTGTPTTFDILAPTSSSPSGSFDAAIFTFHADAPGAAAITFIDNSAELGADATLAWFNDTDFAPIPTTYTQANVIVNAVPAPAAAWLLAPAVLAAGRFSRRRKAA